MGDHDDGKVQKMLQLAEIYSGFTGVAQSSNVKKGSEKAVLITGTTGFLGSHLLSQVLEDSSVDKVFALNRAGKDTLMNRQYLAFKRWGLDTSLLKTKRLVLEVATLHEPTFGIQKRLYDQMKSEVTSIIHNAWLVDFKKDLLAFEPLVAGVRNLLEFASAANARLIFVSSVSVTYGSPAGAFVPEELVQPKIATTLGYIQGKWVSETIVAWARQHGVNASIVRVGQLCGDTKDGAWNPKEWAPSIVLAGKTLGCMPALNQDLYWIPVNHAAAGLLEISTNTTQDYLLYHLAAPRPVKWNAIFGSFARDLHLPLVPYTQWVSLLEFIARSERKGPRNLTAIHLLNFYKTRAFNEPRLGLEHAVLASDTLRLLGPLNSTHVARYLAYWQKTLGLQSKM